MHGSRHHHHFYGTVYHHNHTSGEHHLDDHGINHIVVDHSLYHDDYVPCNLDDCPYRIHDDHPAPQHVDHGTEWQHIDLGPSGVHD